MHLCSRTFYKLLYLLFSSALPSYFTLYFIKMENITFILGVWYACHSLWVEIRGQLSGVPFSVSPVWVPVIESRLQGLAASTFPHWTTLLSIFFCFLTVSFSWVVIGLQKLCMSDYLHIHTLVKGSHNHANNRHSRHLPMWSCASLFGLLVFLLGLWKDTRPSFKFIMYCNICVYYIKRRSLKSINLIYLKLNTYWTT